MNGAEILVRTLLGGGVDTCFANPGTSEMHVVQALDRLPGMRTILALFEGVATGAADGFARLRDGPAATLLHCGPGLANGLANLHNARRAGSAIVNCVGDQATHHRPLDAPLTATTEEWARGASAWVRTTMRPEAVGHDAAAAVRAARAGGGRVATLVLPADVCWGEGGGAGAPLPDHPAEPAGSQAIASAATALRSGAPCALLLGHRALRAAALADANRIAVATGAALFAQMTNARIERGRGRSPISRIPYAIDAALTAFAGTQHVILVGAPPPVGFFAYPGKPGSLLAPGATLHMLARPDHDLRATLALLAEAVGATPAAAAGGRQPAASAGPATGAVTSRAFGQSLAALLPEHAIVVDEGITFVRDSFIATADAAPHDWLQVTGGAIGDGLPLATGAAVACPDRRVVSLEGDGSALYTLQALWTQARERLDVTTIIFANRTYAILLNEFAALGNAASERACGLMDLGNPDLDWVRIANGFGVEASRADTMERLNDLLARSLATPGPFVIELAA